MMIAREHKTIWMLWFQGWAEAPEMVKHCAHTWVARNPDWRIRLIDQADCPRILPDHVQRGLEAGQITLQALSDILRINLLDRFGGVWVDATMWCLKPLDDWLGSVMEAGFFAFERPAPDRRIASWFIASQPGHPISSRFCAVVNDMWIDPQDPRLREYFWFHFRFDQLCREDPNITDLWAAVPKLSARPHFQLQIIRDNPPEEQDIVFEKVLATMPVQKLSLDFVANHSGFSRLYRALYDRNFPFFCPTQS